jgi:hypothetical protein
MVPTIEQIEEAIEYAEEKCKQTAFGDSKIFKIIYNDYLNAIMVYGSPLYNEGKDA